MELGAGVVLIKCGAPGIYYCTKSREELEELCAKLVSRIRKFADEHDVVIKVENLKAHIRQRQEERREKYSFLFAYRSRSELLEHLREAQETWEERHRK